MTEEYKINLLKYFTGNLPDETGNPTEYFSELKINENNFDAICTEAFGSRFWKQGVLQSKTNGLIICWGYIFSEDKSSTYSRIIIFDNDFNVLQTINNFTDGSDFGNFIDLQINETGEFYLLQRKDSKVKLLLLNNICTKIESDLQYSVKIKQEIVLPDEYNNITFNSVRKSPENPYYAFLGMRNSGSSKYISIAELKVNSGSNDEWKIYNDTSEVTTVALDYYPYWGEELSVKIVLNNNNFYLEKRLENGVFKDVNFVTSLPKMATSMVSVSESETYLAITSFESSNNVASNYVYKVDYSNNMLVKIYQNDYAFNKSNESNIQFFVTDNNETFVCEYYPKNADDKDLYYINLGKVEDKTIVFKEVGEIGYNDLTKCFIFVQNNFNLYKICCQTGNQIRYLNQIYNEANYNGSAFINQNCLIPNCVILYDSENNPIFARNLYNKSINDNMTISTVEVPNTLLNGVLIGSQELFSKNNLKLIKNGNALEKNIYEVLYINFINSLKIFDKNDEKVIENKDGEIVLNEAINNENRYDTVKMNKLKINYADETSEMLIVKPANVVYENNKARVQILLRPVKEILSGQLMSNDEKIIYTDMDFSSLLVGKMYKIIQEVEVI